MILYVRMFLYLIFGALAGQGIVVFDNSTGVVSFTVDDVAVVVVGLLGYGPETTTIVRQTPFGPVVADWFIESRVVEEGVECTASGRTVYQVVPEIEGRPAGTVSYFTPPRLRPCLSKDADLVIVQQWQVRLFGFLPLKPLERITIIEK